MSFPSAMLKIEVPAWEDFNPETSEIILHPGATLTLEHSLVSLAKWESKYCRPFMSNDPQTIDESIDYIRFMCLTKNVDPDIFYHIPQSDMNRIVEYINRPMTATTFSNREKRVNKRQNVTAEIIYWEMIALNIPFECQKWHLNRLLTLIHVCALKQEKPKKMSRKAAMEQNAALNAARRKRLGSSG